MDPIFLVPRCPQLTTPSNGWIKLSNGLNVGSKATYFCRSGYVLKGDRTRVCGSNGIWTGSDPVCKSKSNFFQDKLFSTTLVV